MPFFSIITPTFNRAHLLGKMIASVLAQTYTDFEFILVDDGSTDDTKQLVDSYVDDRIRYLYQENGERGKARNTGVKSAKGAYVFFLDSDDLIYPNHLQHAHDELTKRKFPAFFHSRYEVVYANETRQLPALNQKKIIEKIVRQNQFACQFFLERSVALSFPFSEDRFFKIGEDWAVILHIAHRHELHISNEITAAIVHHGERTMEIVATKTIEKSRDLFLEDLKTDEKIPSSVHKNVYAELTTLMALSAAIVKNRKAAWRYWWKGCSVRPRLIFTRRTLAIFKKILFNGEA